LHEALPGGAHRQRISSPEPFEGRMFILQGTGYKTRNNVVLRIYYEGIEEMYPEISNNGSIM
jgi:hypothetical protein